MTRQFDQQLARIAVGAYDDAQDVRKAMLNRVRDIIRKKREDIPFDQVEDEKDDPDYSSEYSDDNLPDLIDEMLENNQLTEREHQYLNDMLEAGKQAEAIERRYKDVMHIIEEEPIYRQYLQHVSGISTVLTARLLHKFGYCEQFDKPSHLWSYCGLAPGQEREKGEKLGYDPDAKTLAWMVADCMIKQGSNSLYRRNFFEPYKDKQERRMKQAEDMTDAQLSEKKWTPPESQGHAHNRAVRYLAKKFLKHYWAISRDMQGHDVPDEWVLTHGGHEKETDTFENPFYARKEVAYER